MRIWKLQILKISWGRSSSVKAWRRFRPDCRQTLEDEIEIEVEESEGLLTWLRIWDWEVWPRRCKIRENRRNSSLGSVQLQTKLLSVLTSSLLHILMGFFFFFLFPSLLIKINKLLCSPETTCTTVVRANTIGQHNKQLLHISERSTLIFFF